MNIYDCAAKRLTSGNRTAGELKDWLSKKGFKDEEIKEVVSEFTELGYIDDERYAADYFRYAAGKGWSKARAIRELARKGVSRDVMEDAYSIYASENADDEEQRALAVVEKMLGPKDWDEGRLTERARNRVARRLFGYGYSSSQIYATIRKIEECQENN